MSAAPAEGPLRVVIIDDTPDLRDLLRLALEGGGFDVVAEAGDGREGIEVASSLHPDVILLDLAMPVMDGLEALPTLRRNCPEAKIVVLSGFGASQMTRRALAAGADGYLQKGVPLSKILGYLRDLTDETGQPPPRSVTVIPDPPRVATLPPAPELPEAVRLAPYGVLEVLDEPVYRVVRANDAAVELLGRPCPPGAPLFSTVPALAGYITQHRLDDEASFEVDLPGRRASVVVRRTSTGRVLLYIVPSDEKLRRQLATVAHELRGPVTVILGVAEALEEAFPDVAEAEHRRLLDSVLRQAHLLDRVAADLLTDAQAAHGQDLVAASTIEPEPFLRRLLARVEGAALEVEDPRPLLVDPHRFEQMVGNLLSNAQKHGRPPYVVRVRPAPDPGSICIDVADHGPGVPPEFEERLFREFSRADGTVVSGTGLGLYVVRILATAHGGAVHHSPGPDGGAVFTLTLPAQPH